MTKLKLWEELDPEVQDRLRNTARCVICRFNYTKATPLERDTILYAIEVYNLEPFHAGQSLAAWDACFHHDGVCYQLIGSLDSSEFEVNIITDNCPEMGPIYDTYDD